MKAVFKDKQAESAFRKTGYTIIPLLGAEEVATLKEELGRFSPDDNYEGNQATPFGKQSFHVTFFDSNRAYRKAVFDFISAQFMPVAGKLLNHYKCLQANVFLKPPQSGFVYPHQNLTITDESRYTSVSFWLPLQDTNFENGTVCLVPGSQNGFVKYRNTHVYWPYVNYFKHGGGLNYLVPINVKAGELLILDDRLIHYTPVNTTNQARWVMHALWAPQEAPVWFCDPLEKEVKVYEVADDFWQYHAPGTFPEATNNFRLIANDETLLGENELEQRLEEIKSGLGQG